MLSRPAKLTLCSALLLAMAGPVRAQFPAPPPPADVPPVASYQIEARLLPEEHAAEGVEILTWNSPAKVPVDRLLFHLYLNAFSNEASTWFASAGVPGKDHPIRPDEWGYTQIKKVEVLNDAGEAVADLTDSIRFIQTDDANKEDRTVLEVPLNRPVRPRGTVRVRIEFTSRLPRFRARTGYFQNFHFFAQWIPKLAVWEPDGMRGRSPGGWNAHQFHSFTEFYADYGNYDVKLTVPEGWAIGATGKSQGKPAAAGGGMTTHHFVQHGVHAFTWFTDSRLQSQTRTFDIANMRDQKEEEWLVQGVGVALEDLQLPKVEVTLFYPPEHEKLVDRQFRAVFESLRYFGYWFGPYPYETLTVLDPPHGGEGAGGMEYPTLITGGAHLWSPEKRLSPEGVLVHEFGHQYWYGLVGNNEFEEAWLDEGFNTYSTARVIDKAYGPDYRYERSAEVPLNGIRPVDVPGSFPGWTSSSWESILEGALYLRPFGVPNHGVLDMVRDVPWLSYLQDVAVPQQHVRRRRFLTDPAAEPISNTSWSLYSRNVLRINSYDRPATTLMTLERVVGAESMLRGMRHYHLRYRYGHPSAYDFVETFNEATGQDLSWFFDAFIFGNETVDFAVGRVDQKKVKPPVGVFFEDGKKELRTREDEDEEEDTASDIYESKVYVRRLGTVAVPVTILVEREGESPIREEWDGKEHFTVLNYKGGKVTRVVVDPDQTWLIDLDFRNNTWMDEKDREPSLRWSERTLLWMQNMLMFYGSLT